MEMFDENVMPEIQEKNISENVVQFYSFMVFGLIRFRVEILVTWWIFTQQNNWQVIYFNLENS